MFLPHLLLDDTQETSVALSLLSDGSFAAATALTGYLAFRCMTPPNEIIRTPDADPSRVKDTLQTGRVTLSHFCILYRSLVLLVAVWQALVILDRHRFAPMTSPEFPMSETFLTWNLLSVTCFTIIWVGAYIRLRAYRELGESFTYELREPDELFTGGLYRYMQHPSYTGAFPSIIGATYWFGRGDGVLATFMPIIVLEFRDILHGLGMVVAVVAYVIIMIFRVREEEKMLRDKFGKQWEIWHQETPRFLPFLF